MRILVESPHMIRAAENCDEGGDRCVLAKYPRVTADAIDNYRKGLTLAIDFYRSGIYLRKRLIQIDPDKAEWRYNLAVTYAKLAEAYRLCDKRKRAEAMLQQAIKILIKLVKLEPENTVWRSELVKLQQQIAGL
jgi:tetratricopeptide (TPR) repeat protein